MNRALWIPGVVCGVAFLGVMSLLSGARGRDAVKASRLGIAEAPTLAARDNYVSTGGLFRDHDALTILRGLANEYLRPWREWEKSPYRMFSRVAPRPLPSMSAEVQLASGLAPKDADYALGTIAIRQEESTETIPCVVDRTTNRVQLFVGGHWLTEGDWLKSAPYAEFRRAVE